MTGTLTTKVRVPSSYYNFILAKYPIILVGSGENALDDEADSSSDVDPILALIDEYPQNNTAADANTPLTEHELLGKCHVLSSVKYSAANNTPEIGLKATQLVSDSKEPLYTLALLSQNFPKYATSIARRVVVNASLEGEVEKNQMKAQPGVNMFWLNGATIAENDVNPFACVWPFFNLDFPG
jgi:hypothetical protein